jgi:late competence protein required for DNA uptake (superfamily II DNA/RNA helicase)
MTTIISKDLQRIVLSEEQSPDSTEMTRLVSNCPKMFYKWNDKMHHPVTSNTITKQCCFWHWVGAPQKDSIKMPVLPYQRLLYRMLKEHKHIWIKKSRGIGVTTFFLYWIAHQCTTQYKPGDRVCIVVGPRIDAAEDLIARFKSLFRENFPAIYSELIRQPSTIAILNGIRIEAFPSHHVDTMRGLDKVKCIMSDETDYYPPFQQREVRAVMEGYIGKPNSDPHIVLVSTPKEPGGLLQTIEVPILFIQRSR